MGFTFFGVTQGAYFVVSETLIFRNSNWSAVPWLLLSLPPAIQQQ